MTHPVVAEWTNAFGGAAVVALGLFVLTVKPRTVATASFSAFAVGFGGYFLAGNVADGLHLPRSTLLSSVCFVAWGVGVSMMAATFPRAVTRKERGPFALAALVTLVLAASGTSSFFGVFAFAPDMGVMLTLSMAAEAVLGGYLVLLVLRYRQSDDPDFRRQAALTAAALTMYVGFIGGFGRSGGDGVLAASGPFLVHAILRLALLATVAALWLASTTGPSARTARNMAWLTLAMPLLGLVMYAGGVIQGGHGVTRSAMAAILAYAILQHQLLGLDVKVRWGISRSTVAAAFIAVFFIASEGAQIAFGQGNEWVGLLAAGALVFALAPLQRAADGLAARAVPVSVPVREGETAPVSRAHAAYKRALRLALRDGRLTETEELEVARLAEDLDIGAGTALLLRREVEAELVKAGGSP